MRRALRTPRRRGFTLVELAIAVAVLAVVFGAVGLFQLRSHDATSAATARALAEAHARRALDRVAEELTGVGQSVLAPDPTGSLGTATLTYQKPLSVSGAGVVTWSSQTGVAATLAPGETDNGLDDNGDGLIDERSLVLTVDVGLASQKAVTLCRGVTRWGQGEVGNGSDDNGNGVVDESGFNVQRTGDLLTIRLTVQKPLGGGRVVAANARTAIVMHN